MSEFCGKKELVFTLNQTSTTLLRANNPDYIHFSPPSDFKDFGIGQATI